jgi:hypothetical protein
MNDEPDNATADCPDEPGRSRYAPGNTREDGSYKVGKNRTPEHSRYRAGDGRRRGRRPKGHANFETDLLREARRHMTVRENGIVRRVTKQQASIIRAFDSSCSKGDPRTTSLLFHHLSQIEDKEAAQSHSLPEDDEAELDAWLLDRLAVLQRSDPDPTLDGPDTPAEVADPPAEADDEH